MAREARQEGYIARTIPAPGAAGRAYTLALLCTHSALGAPASEGQRARPLTASTVAATSATPGAPAPTSASRSQPHPLPGSPVSRARRSGGQARRTPVLVMTVSSTLRGQPREDSGRSVLVFKGQHVTDMGVWTPLWQYVSFKGHRGWVLTTHLSGLR